MLVWDKFQKFQGWLWASKRKSTPAKKMRNTSTNKSNVPAHQENVEREPFPTERGSVHRMFAGSRAPTPKGLGESRLNNQTLVPSNELGVIPKRDSHHDDYLYARYQGGIRIVTLWGTVWDSPKVVLRWTRKHWLAGPTQSHTPGSSIRQDGKWKSPLRL